MGSGAGPVGGGDVVVDGERHVAEMTGRHVVRRVRADRRERARCGEVHVVLQEAPVRLSALRDLPYARRPWIVQPVDLLAPDAALPAEETVEAVVLLVDHHQVAVVARQPARPVMVLGAGRRVRRGGGESKSGQSCGEQESSSCSQGCVDMASSWGMRARDSAATGQRDRRVMAAWAGHGRVRGSCASPVSGSDRRRPVEGCREPDWSRPARPACG
jgi:hypothetical protein